MRHSGDPASTARAIIAANLYMVLATADERGQPWASPVYYAPRGLSEFIWVSRPDALHSRNIAARPEISIVIFDSSVPIGRGQGVYMAAVAEQLTGEARRDAIESFSRRSSGHGGGEFTVGDVEPPAELRLYRATADVHYVLGETDLRIPVDVSAPASRGGQLPSAARRRPRP